MDEIERLSKEKSLAPDIGSAVSFFVAVAGSTVGCLFAAKLLGNSKFSNENTELEEMQKHLKVAIPFIIGGITQMYMLPTEYRTTAISNTKMRAALAGRQRDDDEIQAEQAADLKTSIERNKLTALYK